MLGLTFTTKAASELRARIREALRGRRLLGPDAAGARRRRARRTSSSRPSRPTTPTPPALLTEHGLRIGHEPDTRVIADASRYQLGARVVDRHTRPSRAAHRPPRDRRSSNLLALDGAMSEHLVDAGRRARASTRGRASPRVRGRAGRRDPQDLPRAVAKALNAIERRERAARPGRGLPPAQARPRADGLLRPDRARRPAGRRAARGRGGSSATKFRVVLLDEYQDTSVAQALMLCRLFSGPDREPAAATRSPPSATPTRRSTAGAGASVSNILGFGRRLPGRRRRRRRPDVPADASTAAPTAASSRSPTSSPRRSTPQCAPGAARSSAKPDAGAGDGAARASTRRTPRSWPGWPSEVPRRARERCRSRPGARSAC